MEELLKFSGSSLLGAILTIVFNTIKLSREKEKENRIREEKEIEKEKNLEIKINSLSETVKNTTSLYVDIKKEFEEHKHKQYEDSITKLGSEISDIKDSLKNINKMSTNIELIIDHVKDLKETNKSLSKTIAEHNLSINGLTKDIEYMKEAI